MTPEQLKMHWDVALAHRDGRKIQWSYYGSTWTTFDPHQNEVEFLSPAFNWRVAPPIATPRRWWIAIHQDTQESWALFGIKPTFDNPKMEVVEVQEVVK